MPSLRGKTLFITGASRGIGLAIGRRAARDGANVVIAAKTTEAHPSLPGTIYTAAAEIEAAGGKALACAVDIRDEQQIQVAVQQAVKTFGGIDILVNNASAISLTGTLQTPLKQAQNPHILNLSPPLNMEARWFAPHVAYTMAKYGMSMGVLGLAAEFAADGVAVNALWPRTTIATAAVQNLLGGDEAVKHCRTPKILADAAYIILTRPSRECTGRFFIDDEVLASEGITDLDQYAVEPGNPLQLDFFI